MENEKRLIDANALREYMFAEVDKYGENYLFIDIAIDAIDNAPTVDAVEVVRCRDCIHYDNSEGICWCKLNSKFFPGGMDWHGFPEDGFCSYGEKREGERRDGE